VAHDALAAAKSRKTDVLIVDTAGRLQTKYNLMEELKKVRGVIAKFEPGAPHETLLVLDAVTGQNALSQAKAFKEAVGVTGVILAKLDGSAKGGMAFAIRRELGLPICFAGTGEQFEDFEVFDPDKFVAGLLD
jgi:fused signal recognition particle receptor